MQEMSADPRTDTLAIRRGNNSFATFAIVRGRSPDPTPANAANENESATRPGAQATPPAFRVDPHPRPAYHSLCASTSTGPAGPCAGHRSRPLGDGSGVCPKQADG